MIFGILHWVRICKITGHTAASNYSKSKSDISCGLEELILIEIIVLEGYQMSECYYFALWELTGFTKQDICAGTNV
jgi:hypothetical protein